MKTRIILLALIISAMWASAQWVQTNGPPGADISLSAVLISGDNLLAGSIGNGMYLSTDDGLSWSRIEPDISNVYEFAVSGAYIFAGTRWGGVLRSSDHGVTWTKLTNGVPDYIETLAVGGNKIYAGLDRVYWSQDNGDTWTTQDTTSNFQVGISAIASNGNMLFAAYYDEGVFLSKDDGGSWTKVSNELEGKHIITLTLFEEYIFAGTADYGVFRSADNGASWTQVNDGMTNLTVTCFLVIGTTIFAGTINGGLCKTENHGDLWTPANTGLNGDLGVLSMWADGTDFILGSNSGGIYASGNSGVSWTQLYGLPVSWVSSLVTKDGIVFAGTFHDGLFRTTNNGGSWEECENGIPFWLSILSLTDNGNDIYAGTGDGVFVSKDNGDSWIPLHNGFPDYVHINSIITVGTSIFAGTNDFGVYRSTDQGASWTPVNNGLTSMTVLSLAANAGNLFAGTPDGIFKSTNNGDSWAESNQGLTYLFINSLIIQGSSILAGTYDGGGIFVSTNNGDSWTQVLPDLQISSFAKSDAIILASSFSGLIFFSWDNGLSWHETTDPFPPINIYAIGTSGTHIFAGTYDGGVFINSTLLSRTSDQATDIHPIRIYPNPALQSITFETTELIPSGVLTIYTVHGQQILQREITGYQTHTDISGLPGGLYLVRYGNGISSSAGKFIKE